ncbi:low affinity immunoglobulin epsilon Fc receptor-like [Amphibalanus amphitrite]|uniref:low affinity immunoglobulin epsilon Fc receptor-like n=1 Tax=Amphibalanus amphitrite TaxID=1232801 RepID=UPI001C926E67|nr:low affinity immunoglobulin epsilon Fc receptor-like [Amphibalanus amphitrite]
MTADVRSDPSYSAEQRAIRSGIERLQNQLTALQDRLAAAETADAACPPGWSRRGSRCYLLPAVTATWMGPSTLCPAMDRRARLVSVHADNHQEVEELVAASGAAEVWAGGVRLRQGGVDWGWVDGTPYEFANWAPGPSSTNVGEDCIIMRGPKSGYPARVGQWHDGLCCHPGSHFNFMCQITLH